MNELQIKRVEDWKPIPEFEKYIINKEGVIISKLKERDIVLQQRLNTSGYFRVTLYGNLSLFKTLFVHRLVAKTFIPNPDNKPLVNHKNGIKTDNRVENLEWCDNSENQLHAYDNGLKKTGIGRYNSKLNEAKILSIRRLLAKGVPMRAIGERHGVSATVILQIKKGTAWKRV